MPKNLTKIFITGMITLFAAQAFAQKGVEDGSKYGHGKDSIRCLENLSLFTEYTKQKSYADAIESWEICFNECPLAHSKIYSEGVKIMEWRFKNEQDDVKKEELFKQLMGVYDQRIKYFGKTSKKYDESYILGAKALKLLQIKGKEPEAQVQAQEWLKKSIDGKKSKSQSVVIFKYFTNTIDLYRADKIGAEDVVKAYIYTNDLLALQIESSTKESKKEKSQQIKDNIETRFAKSGVADCNTIETIFAPQLAENKENIDWLKLVNKLLARANCEDAQLLYDVSESLHAIEPSSTSAYGLARMYLKTGDIPKAAEYYNEAISLEEDADQKAKLYYQLGLVKSSQSKLFEARANARKAIELRPDWGSPYILIGNLYANSATSFGKDEFEHKTAYWAAVDQYYKAKSVDPSTAAEANNLIGVYSKHFPGTEEIFFHNLQVGASHTIGGWIGVSTKVRAKN